MKLSPCPFCGTNYLILSGDEKKVKCTNLNCYMSNRFIWVPVEQWNNRPNDCAKCPQDRRIDDSENPMLLRRQAD